MKNYMIGIMFVIACGTGGCEKDTFHDTGLADGVFDGTAWEYMQAVSYTHLTLPTILLV